MVDTPNKEYQNSLIHCCFMLASLLVHFFEIHRLALNRSSLSNRRMNPQTVVPNLDVLPDVSMRPFARFVRLYMYELTVNDAVKCFNASVVVTVALATHAAFYLVLFPPCLVLIGRILAASIRRMQHAISWFSRLYASSNASSRVPWSCVRRLSIQPFFVCIHP